SNNINYFLTHQTNNSILKFSNDSVDEKHFLSRFERTIDSCKSRLQKGDEFRAYRSNYTTKRKELLKFLLLLVYIAKNDISVELDISNDYVLIDVENFYYCKEEDY